MGLSFKMFAASYTTVCNSAYERTWSLIAPFNANLVDFINASEHPLCQGESAGVNFHVISFSAPNLLIVSHWRNLIFYFNFLEAFLNWLPLSEIIFAGHRLIEAKGLNTIRKESVLQLLVISRWTARVSKELKITPKHVPLLLLFTSLRISVGPK